MAASKTIGSINVSITATTERFRKQINTARTSLGKFTKSIEKTIFSVKGLAAALTGGAIAAAVKQQLQLIDSLAKTADKLGLTTEALQGLRHAAELSGLASNTLDMALQRMTRRLAEAARGTGEARGALQELGLDAKFLATLSPDQQLGAIADAMAQVQSQSDRVRLAFKLFDSEGVAMVNMLKGGSAELNAMVGELANFGGAIDREAAAKVEAANDAITRLKATVGLLVADLTVQLAPALQTTADNMRTWASESTGWVGKIADVIHTVKLLFKGLRMYFTMAIAAMVEKWSQLRDAVISVLNLVPGVEISHDGFIKELHKSMQRASRQQQQEFNKALMEKTPSEKMRERMGAGTGASTTPTPQASAVSGVGSAMSGMLGAAKLKAQRFAMEKGFHVKLMAGVATMLGQAAMIGMKQPQVERLNNASIGAIDARSREGFAQRVRAMRNDPQMRVQRDQLRELKDIARNTRKSADEAAAAFA